MNIITKIKEIEHNFNIPNEFDEGCMLSKDEIIDEDMITSEDLANYSDDLLTYCGSFVQNGVDMLISVVIDEDISECMYIITEGESTLDKLIKKGFLKL